MDAMANVADAPQADRRSWLPLQGFLKEIFGKP
jgi:hypothetical protein